LAFFAGMEFAGPDLLVHVALEAGLNAPAS
jgi:hypothetical protein